MYIDTYCRDRKRSQIVKKICMFVGLQVPEPAEWDTIGRLSRGLQVFEPGILLLDLEFVYSPLTKLPALQVFGPKSGDATIILIFGSPRID